MKITAINETRAKRFSLFIDEKFIASIDALTLGEYGLCVGDELTEEKLEEILRLAQNRKTKLRAVNLLSYRPFSKAELKRKLMTSASEEDADNAVARMEELQMVDDLAYAKLIVREFGYRKQYGVHRVVRELARRGIEKDIMREALDELPDQVETINRFLIRCRIELKGDYIDRERLTKKLLSRGFDYDDVRPVMWNFEIEEKK